MRRRLAVLAVLAVAAGCGAGVPVTAQAHVSLHPNAIPAGSFATTNIRVPSEDEHASTTAVEVKLPAGVLSALGAPPAGWTFSTKTKKLTKPIKTDDGLVTTETTEVDYTGGRILPGDFQSFPLTMSMPAAATAGSVVAFPTIQRYSSGKVVRWIGDDDAETPAPTIDVTAAGGALYDVTGGDAGPPAKLPAGIEGTSTAAAHVPATIVRKQTSTVAIIALIGAGLVLVLAAAALTATRRNRSRQELT
jgi:periplasmic copper chaperone A